jgi:hypothetical protein
MPGKRKMGERIGKWGVEEKVEIRRKERAVA